MRFTESNQRSQNFFIWLFIALGVFAVGAGGWMCFQGIRCKSWPVVEGTVGTVDIRPQSSVHHGESFLPTISYEYSVAGTHYTGEKIAFGTISGSSDYASEVIRRYPVGSKVPVHYCPTGPEVAVIETGIHGGVWICFTVGALFITFASIRLRFITALQIKPSVTT